MCWHQVGEGVVACEVSVANETSHHAHSRLCPVQSYRFFIFLSVSKYKFIGIFYIAFKNIFTVVSFIGIIFFIAYSYFFYAF